MLRQTSPVRDVVSHVFVPVTQQLVDKFLTELGLKEIFDNKVYINSDSTASSTSTNDDHNPKLKENKISVNMSYNLNPMTLKWPTATFNHVLGGPNFLNNEHDIIPVFYDILTQTTLVERESPANIEMTISMDFVDRVYATEAVNRLVTMYTNGEKIIVSDLAYNYPIPAPIYTTIYGLYKYLGNDVVNLTAANIVSYYGSFLVGPDVILDASNAATYVDTQQEIRKDDFVTYLSKFSGGRIGTNVNRHVPNGKKELVVKKNNAQVIAQIDYDGGKSDAIGNNQSADIYRVEFALTLQFSRCNMMHLSYPIVVQNQMISEELVTVDPKGSYRKPNEDHPYFSINLYKRLMEGNRVVAPEIVNIPWYDDWKLGTSSPLRKFGFREFLTVALTLDNVGVENGTSVIDITTDLPYALIPEILDLYALHGADCLDYESPVFIGVYANDFQVETDELEFDGTTLTIHRQDINPVYRLVFAEYIGDPNAAISSLRVLNYDIIAKRQ